MNHPVGGIMSEARVLIVDDDRSIVRLCQKVLERANFDVLVGNSAEEALGYLRTEKLDLLLVDIRMPDMDGFELAALAKQIRPDIAILLMTGHGTVETAITALHRGIDGLILKPFETTAELVEKCHEILLNRLQRKNAARLEALRPIFNISELLISETNPAALIKLVSGAISGMLRPTLVQIYRLGAGKDQYELIENLGDPDIWLQVTIEHGDLRKILQKGSPVLINKTDPDGQTLQIQMVNHHIVSLMVAPVQLKNDNYIYLATRNEGEPVFQDSEFEMFVILVRQSTVALDNARLYEDLRLNMRKLEESQRALVQAEKMSAVGRLLASVAHEVNNPLQSVRNCLHLAGRPEIGSAEQRKYIQLAQDELNRLAGIVSQMLDFYRPGKLEKEIIQLGNVLQKVHSLLQPQFRDRFIKVNISVPLNLPAFWGATDQIQQVIFNLLLNAMDALDEIKDGRNIWIEALSQDDAICLWVEDSGHGIATSLESQIFEPFISTKKNGTGLGLSVSYSIMEAHGGSIRTVPALHGNGARFEIRIPIRLDSL
jgi:signal transduction histidine kinase/CheY-like chemotaxis protein